MAHLRQSAPLPESKPSSGALVRLCPACGDLLVNGRCPECAPAAPARAYGESSGRKTAIFAASFKSASPAPNASAVDSRRASAEWVMQADEAEPQTRKAHPTLVRTALNEAGELARARLSRETMAYPRRGESASRNQTDPRVNKVPDFRDALGEGPDSAQLQSDARSRATSPVSVASALAAQATASTRHNNAASVAPSSDSPAHPSTSKRVRPSASPSVLTSQPAIPAAAPAAAVTPAQPRVRTLSATGMAAANDLDDAAGLRQATCRFQRANRTKTFAIVLGAGAVIGCLCAALF